MVHKKVKLYLLLTVALVLLICNYKTDINTVPVIKILDGNISSEELASQLIKDVYRNVKFEKQTGNGDDFLVRFYCSNICIDACSGGVVRYLCDVTAKSEEDLFQKWLFNESEFEVKQKLADGGVIYKEIESKLLSAALYINSENNRVFAAKISIKYQQQ